MKFFNHSRRQRLGKLGMSLYLLLSFIFLYAPIAVLIVYSFNDSQFRGHWGGFSLRWYQSMFFNETIMSALYYTLLIAVLAAIFSTIIGTAAAVAIARLRQRTGRADG